VPEYLLRKNLKGKMEEILGVKRIFEVKFGAYGGGVLAIATLSLIPINLSP
jgi:hypothetical protein